MKYLLQPIPKSNPYQKIDQPNPYTSINPQQKDPYRESSPHGIIQVLQQPSVKIYCNSCKKQITHHSYTKQEKQDLCIGCFSKQQSYPSQYYLVEKLDFPIFQTGWTAYQQALLLHSIQKWNFGNWKEIREYMQYFGTKFTQDEIETHYNTFYLTDRTFLPRFTQSLIERKMQMNNCKLTINQNPVSKISLATNHPQDGINYTFQQMEDFSHQAMIESLPDHLIPTPAQRIIGYNSNRRQFEVNFDQTAQKVLSNLEFRDDDLPEERAVKYKIIQQYNQRLNKRYQVQDFIVEHRLLDVEYQKDLEEGRTQYEKQAATQLKPLMRFSSFDTHNELVKRVALQKELKSIIEGLRSFRRTSQTGKLKEITETLRKQSVQLSPSKARGRPRKIIHVDNTESTFTTQQSKKSKNQDELIKKFKINMNDLKHIIKESSSKNNGDAFKYKGVEVTVVERK